MSRPVQVGDYVRILSEQGDNTYTITKILDSTIYLSGDEGYILSPINGEYQIFPQVNGEYQFLPGEPDLFQDPSLIIELLAQMEDEDLNRMCSTNKDISDICSGKELWNLKLQNTYNQDIINVLASYVPSQVHPKQAYLELGELFSSNDPIEYAIEKDSPYLFHFVEYQNGEDYIVSAIENDSLNGLKWLIENGAEVSEYDFLRANMYSLDIVKFLYPMFPEASIDDATGFAAIGGNLPVLKWWSEPPRNVSFDSTIYNDAFSSGSKEVIDWLEEQDIPITQDDINQSVYGGIPTLELLESKGWYLDTEGANFALLEVETEKGPPFLILDWLAERGIFPSPEVFQSLDRLKQFAENMNYISLMNTITSLENWLYDHNIYP